MNNLQLAEHPEIINQLIDARFELTMDQIDHTASIGNDFYMDLLCVFHDPDRFDAKDFQQYPLTSILTYLRQTHKLYQTKILSDIGNSIAELAKADPKFSKLEGSLTKFFQDFRKDLEEHIQEEEEHLFPYIDALVGASSTNSLGIDWEQKVKLMDFLMHHDDSNERDLKELIIALSKASSFKDSFAFRMMVNRLSIFELDLSIHAKIEEEVLMPLAVDLEKKVLKEQAQSDL